MATKSLNAEAFIGASISRHVNDAADAMPWDGCRLETFAFLGPVEFERMIGLGAFLSTELSAAHPVKFHTQAFAKP